MFGQKTLDFLAENRRQNSHQWFHDHKSEYRAYVLEPLKALVEYLAPQALAIDDQVVSLPRVDKTICRIWRDTRYSHDKSLYRENMWIIFRRFRMHEPGWPGLYFELSPDGFSYGCGFYKAVPGFMETVREMILQKDPLFLSALAAFEGQSLFCLHGERFKRPRFAEQPENPREWLNRRNLTFTAQSAELSQLFSRELPEKVRQGYEQLAPIYAFLLEASQKTQQKKAPFTFYEGGGKQFEF